MCFCVVTGNSFRLQLKKTSQAKRFNSSRKHPPTKSCKKMIFVFNLIWSFPLMFANVEAICLKMQEKTFNAEANEKDKIYRIKHTIHIATFLVRWIVFDGMVLLVLSWFLELKRFSLKQNLYNWFQKLVPSIHLF